MRGSESVTRVCTFGRGCAATPWYFQPLIEIEKALLRRDPERAHQELRMCKGFTAEIIFLEPLGPTPRNGQVRAPPEIHGILPRRAVA